MCALSSLALLLCSLRLVMVVLLLLHSLRLLWLLLRSLCILLLLLRLGGWLAGWAWLLRARVASGTLWGSFPRC